MSSAWRTLEPSLEHLTPAVRAALRRVVESPTAHGRQQELKTVAQQFAGELSPLILRLTTSTQVEARRLALELVGRQRSPSAAVARAATGMLVEERIPMSARLAATRGLLRAAGRDRRAAFRVLRHFAAGLGQKRVERLDRSAKWLDRPRLVARLRAELVGRERLRCPRCGQSRRRDRMPTHLWNRHRLLLDGRQARSDYATLDKLLDTTTPTEALTAVHRRILVAGLADDEAREQLFADARNGNAGVCPRCFGRVPVGKSSAVATRGASRSRPTLAPSVRVRPDRIPAIVIAVAVVTSLATLIAPPIVAVVAVLLVAMIVGGVYVWRTHRRVPIPAVDVLETAWLEPVGFDKLRSTLDDALAGRVPLADVGGLSADVSLLPVAEQARLRTLLCEGAFTAGLTATELDLLGRAFPPFDLLFADHPELLALLARLWQLRGERPWKRCGPATSVFELARYPSLARDALERADDLLLFHPLPPPGPLDEPATIALCGRGIQFRGGWIDEPGEVRLVRLRVGGFEVRVNAMRWRFSADPGAIAGRLKRWIEFWFGEFLAGVGGEAGLSARWVELLHANAATCRDCGADAVPTPGRMALAVPRVAHRG